MYFESTTILICVFFTSVLSGILGMGGGIILMSVLTFFLPVEISMIFHGTVQMGSNGFRIAAYKKDIQFHLMFKYLVGVAVTTVILRYINFVPSKKVMLLGLGLVPLVSFIPRVGEYLSITRKHRAYIGGAVTNISLLFAGVSGGILDIFFVNSPLTRFEIVATKALSQFLGHVVKVAYFISIIGVTTFFDRISLVVIFISLVLTVLGNIVGKSILKRMSDLTFKRYVKYFLLIVGISLIIRAINY